MTSVHRELCGVTEEEYDNLDDFVAEIDSKYLIRAPH